MKNIREIKVAILAVVCGCILFFGFHFLKGVNIFSSSIQYVGQYDNVGGLTEQAPVLIKGYKVGLVDKIVYDFSSEKAFTVYISIDKNIRLTEGTEMVLTDNGLLGGKAICLTLSDRQDGAVYAKGDTLPTRIELGLVESLQEGLLKKLDQAVADVDSLVNEVNGQLAGNHIQNTLAQVDQITSDLTTSARDIKHVTHDQLPPLMGKVDGMVDNIDAVAENLKEADLKATVARVDRVVDSLNTIINSKEGTLGLLLNDKNLYQHIDSTVVSVDSLVTDLKANPKRYVHFSLFGRKEKKKK